LIPGGGNLPPHLRNAGRKKPANWKLKEPHMGEIIGWILLSGTIVLIVPPIAVLVVVGLACLFDPSPSPTPKSSD
jgi:hypothetical protein